MKELGSRWELSGYLAIGLLILATMIAYGNAWPNVLIHDDKYFAGTPGYAELADIPKFFTEDLWAATGAESHLYRPVLLLTLALESRIYGDWLAGYHLDNILLHLLVSIFVYSFLRQVSRTAADPGPSSDLYALLAALVFAVHPVHTEVVNSIFNRSEMLVALAAAAGLWWLLYFLEGRPVRAWSGLALCYLFALFSKESAIVFPAIAVALVLILVPGPFTSRLRKCLPVFWLLLPLAFYLFLRAHALALPEPDALESTRAAAETPAQTHLPAQTPTQTPAPKQTPIQTLAQTLNQTLAQTSAMVAEARFPGFARISETAGVWGQALWLILWPDPLLLYHEKPSSGQQLVFVVLQLALLIMAFLQFRARRYGLLAALVFFYLALMPASRLVVGAVSAPALAERYLYFPSVGLAILLASGFRLLGRRGEPWHAVVVAFTALILLAGLTWTRNNDWANELRLLESDYRRGGQGVQLLRLLTAAHLRAGSFGRAVEICETTPFEGEEQARYANHCAIAYDQAGRSEDAERAFLQAAQESPSQPVMHANLAQFYLRQGRREDAIRQFEQAVEEEDRLALRAYRRGEMLVYLFPRNRQKLLEARSHFAEAIRLQPRLRVAQQWLDRLDRILGPPRSTPADS